MSNLRNQLIRLAHAHPEFRKSLLPLLKTSGCEKLPEGGMRENCEAKKEEGKTAAFWRGKFTVSYVAEGDRNNDGMTQWKGAYTWAEAIKIAKRLAVKTGESTTIHEQGYDLVAYVTPDGRVDDGGYGQERQRKTASSPSATGRNWVEKQNPHRWVWTGSDGPSFTVSEKPGPAGPIYKMQMLLPDGNMYQTFGQKTEPEMWFKRATQLYADWFTAGGFNLSLTPEKWSKMANFPAGDIGQTVSGPEGVPGSDAQKPWSKDEFTQQEFVELDDRQESGDMSGGKPNLEPMKVAKAAYRKARLAGKSQDEALKIASDASGMSAKALAQYPKMMLTLKYIREKIGELSDSMVNLSWNPTNVALSIVYTKDIQKSIDSLKDLTSQLQYFYTKEIS